MSNQHLAELMALLKAEGAPPLEMTARRAAFADLAARLSEIPASVRATPVSTCGVGSEWVEAEGADPSNVVMFFHAGGFSTGTPSDYRDLAARIAQASKMRVLSFGYRLAPEHPFPAALEDAIEGFHWLSKEVGSPSRISLVGMSAGGGLALSLMQALREKGMALPRAAGLISPWVDLSLLSRSIDNNAAFDPHVRRESAVVSVGRYLGHDQDPASPSVSPLFGNLAGLPPLIVQVGLNDGFLDDSLRLTARARRAGVAVDLDVWEDMVHIWPFYAKLLPEGREAIAGLGRFLIKMQTGQTPDKLRTGH